MDGTETGSGFAATTISSESGATVMAAGEGTSAVVAGDGTTAATGGALAVAATGGTDVETSAGEAIDGCRDEEAGATIAGLVFPGPADVGVRAVGVVAPTGLFADDDDELLTFGFQPSGNGTLTRLWHPSMISQHRSRSTRWSAKFMSLVAVVTSSRAKSHV